MIIKSEGATQWTYEEIKQLEIKRERVVFIWINS
jgi:hypothetical protein